MGNAITTRLGVDPAWGHAQQCRKLVGGEQVVVGELAYRFGCESFVQVLTTGKFSSVRLLTPRANLRPANSPGRTAAGDQRVPYRRTGRRRERTEWAPVGVVRLGSQYGVTGARRGSHGRTNTFADGDD
jgi:hypothetical protein